MPQLAANLTMLFNEVPFHERFAAAARAGFAFVEYQFPYDLGTPEQVAGWARAARVDVVLHNLPLGDATHGDAGIACLPDRVAEFRSGVEQAIAYATAAGCRRLNCLAGNMPAGLQRQEMLDTLIDNLAFAADRCQKAGIVLMLEPLNPHTMPSYLLRTSAEAVAVIGAVAHPNLRLQYDLFQMQMAEGNLAATIERLLPCIGHMQIAGVPGRHEPDAGELNGAWLLAHIDRLGYTGFVGCEYRPSANTLDGLEWARPWLKQATI